MALFHFGIIPEQLLQPSNFDEDINILIGENGSGKSTLLQRLSKHYLNQNSNVIAIANTIYDKFNSNGNKLKILRASTGKTLARTTIVNAFKILAQDDLKRVTNIANTLEYITDEIAAAVSFLASPDASFITGATLNVDGGQNA